MSLIKIGALAAPLLLAATLSSAEVDVRVYVPTRPPALIVERRPVAPSSGHVWISGYHRWEGRAYVWTPGRWEPAPRLHARWIAGRWRSARNGWYWTEGRWR